MAFVFTWTGTTLDEEVFSFDLQQTEGEFATLQIEIRNPRAPLLAPSAPLWGALSKDGTVLFHGRLLALPDSLAQDVVSLSFVARPDDYDASKRTLADSLKVAPFYDPVWYGGDRREDPDVVLEARPALWHVDRVTHAVTVSDINVGEAGLVVFGGGSVLADSVSLKFGAKPARRVVCTATVQWQESAAGIIDLSGRLGRIESYTGQGLIEDWPKAGTRIGGGWSVHAASATRIDGAGAESKVLAIKTADGSHYGLPLWTVQPTFKAGYAVERSREETVSFEVVADVQPIASDGEEDLLQVALTSAEIDQPIDAGGLMPIGDLRRKSYFTTDRGRLSLEHLVLLCRARLLARARAVTVSWQTSFDQAAALTLRHNAQIVDDRLPGGQATGKVTGLRLTVNGDSGEAVGEVTIACSIGRGGSIVPVTGPETYADGYASGYAEAEGSFAITGGASDLTWSWGTYTLHDDGIDLMAISAANCVQSLVIQNAAAAQRTQLLAQTLEDLQGALGVLNENYTEVALALRPLTGGPFATTIPVETSLLAVPRTINLEAA
ncbi:hypothetical protein AA309_20245 [Microvirga vignae]|uniref:Uncharacterized protein n=1 Tax=Microvirga vignae TaxID=1225564 RepID=A0A0H1RFP8_9HYPH|nr:hypothetical protein [Microvirga vignae]KLK91427.1 hypothetical protein AA309_20245 [Microvirga vignae]